MLDKIRFNKEYTEFFFLDEGKLRKIVEILEGHSTINNEKKSISFEIVKSDDSTFKTDDLNRVLTDDNIKGREIRKLTIRLNNKTDYGDYCTINFDATSDPNKIYGDKPVSYRINLDDKALGYSLSEELDLFIKRTLKGKKMKLSKVLEWMDDLMPVVIFCISLLSVFKYYPQLNLKVCDLVLSQILIGLPIIVVFLIMLFSLYELIEPFKKLDNIIVGKSIFYLGDQIEIYDKQKRTTGNIVWIVIVGFLVSLVASLIISLSLK